MTRSCCPTLTLISGPSFAAGLASKSSFSLMAFRPLASLMVMVLCVDGRVPPWSGRAFLEPANARSTRAAVPMLIAPKPLLIAPRLAPPSKRQWLLKVRERTQGATSVVPRCCSRGKSENSRQRYQLFALRWLPGRFAIRFRFRRQRYHRKLQHGCALACHKSRKEDDAPRWKLQRIVMFVGTVWIDSPEACRVFPHLLCREKSQRVIALNVAVEYKLRSGRETDRQLWVSYLGKSACNRVAEYGRHQLVANFGGTAFHVL